MKNTIILVGNGFDLAHGFKTSFTDFANYFIEERIIPELEYVISYRKFDNHFFSESFKKDLLGQSYTTTYDSFKSSIFMFIRDKDKKGLKKFLSNDYKKLEYILANNLLGKLYAGSDKNWFHIENTYFKELIKLKELAQRGRNKFPYEKLQILNREFNEIKREVKEYLETIEIIESKEIKEFLQINLSETENIYVINFNYTTSFKQYAKFLNKPAKITLNHIHGSLEKDNIIFGYGNDENDDYQEIKNLEIDEFLRHFKTFDYLNNINYDLIYEEAIDSFEEYEVMVLGHSLGLTDKTLLSEILNSEKCKKIYFYKRSDLYENESLTKSTFRELIYSASRILTNEKILRKRLLNFEESKYFP